MLKIGLQNFHHDEVTALRQLLDIPNATIYSWEAHNYDRAEIESCDVLVLFSRRHWRYIPFNKPYLLILADYVSEQKAINITKTRKLGLFGYRYSPNDLFRGYLCGSGELLQIVHDNHLKGIFYPKKYPFRELFQQYSLQTAQKHPRHIVSLINDYKYNASKRKWSRVENSYLAYKYIEKNSPQFSFHHYGYPHSQVSFEDAVKIQYDARYTIHVKYWGHVCNAVVKSLALGTPVIMDEMTFNVGRYRSYIRNGENSLVFKNKDAIVEYLADPAEEATWLRLKQTCMQEAHLWQFPYSDAQKKEWMSLLDAKWVTA